MAPLLNAHALERAGCACTNTPAGDQPGHCMSGTAAVPFCACHVPRSYEYGKEPKPFCFVVGGQAGCPEAAPTFGGVAAVRACDPTVQEQAQSTMDEKLVNAAKYPNSLGEVGAFTPLQQATFALAMLALLLLLLRQSHRSRHGLRACWGRLCRRRSVAQNTKQSDDIDGAACTGRSPSRADSESPGAYVAYSPSTRTMRTRMTRESRSSPVEACAWPADDLDSIA